MKHTIKDRINMVGVLVITTIFFSCTNHSARKTNDTEKQNATVSEKVESEEFDIKKFQEDIYSKLDRTPSTKELTYLTLIKDYEAIDIYHEDNDSIEPETFSFSKGESICQSTDENIEENDNGYVINVRSCGEYFIPRNIVKSEKIKIGNIDEAILDKAILRFKSDEGKICSIFRLKKNGKRVIDETGSLHYKIYCFRENEHRTAIVMDLSPSNDSYYGMNTHIALQDYDEIFSIDKDGSLIDDIEADVVTYPGCLFYVPSKRALLYDREWFYLSAIEPTSFDSELTEQEERKNDTKRTSTQKGETNYPSWIIGRWHISTPHGFYLFEIEKNNVASLAITRGMNEGTPQSGRWTYSHSTPRSSIFFNFNDGTSVKLLVDEQKEIIMTEDGYGLYSSDKPSRNQYANPVSTHKCGNCGGTGQIAQRGGGTTLGYTTCPNCGGSGQSIH